MEPTVYKLKHFGLNVGANLKGLAAEHAYAAKMTRKQSELSLFHSPTKSFALYTFVDCFL